MNGIGHNGGPLGDGWIARHRSVRDHWLVGHGLHVKAADPTRKRCHTQGEAWEDLIMECRYEAATVSNGSKKMDLRRGEMIGAVSWLANRWNWTPKTVRRFLDQLENDEMIELKNPASEKGNQIGRQANVVTVCNYDVYQNGMRAEQPREGQPEGNQRAARGRPEGNNIRKNKGTREQGNKGEEISPPEISEQAAAGGPIPIPQIGALNGATAMIVNDLALWLNPYSPQHELAHQQVKQAVAAYGDAAVRDGYMDLKADHADGKVRALTVKAFFGFCRTAKERPRRSPVGSGKPSRF